MKHQIAIIVLLVLFKMGYAQELSNENQKLVKTFVLSIKKADINKLKSLVVYPLKRDYPLSDIKNEQEFQSRYSELFDEKLKKIITESDPTKDWSTVGMSGIMLNNGIIWLNSEGKLIAVNYKSTEELNVRDAIVEKDRSSVHKSLSDFAKPAYLLETKRFKLRVDEMKDGQYRYASWSSDKEMTYKPDLVLTNGQRIYDGSGGNHYYHFKNGIYTYEIYVFVIGEKQTPTAELNVYKNKTKIVHEPAITERNVLPFDKSNLLITSKQVGIFKIGEKFPFTQAKALSIDVRKENQIRYTEDGQDEETNFIFTFGDEDLIKVQAHYDYKTNTYTDKIGEILVVSDQFKTEKGVEVGTTIRTFMTKYPDYSLWYTYISGMYVIESKQLKAQFLLEEEDFIGKMNVSGDMTILKKSDFKEGAQIKSIRLF